MTSEIRPPQLLNCDQWILEGVSLPPICACAGERSWTLQMQWPRKHLSSNSLAVPTRVRKAALCSHWSCRLCFSIVFSPGTAGSDECNSDQWIICLLTPIVDEKLVLHHSLAHSYCTLCNFLLFCFELPVVTGSDWSSQLWSHLRSKESWANFRYEALYCSLCAPRFQPWEFRFWLAALTDFTAGPYSRPKLRSLQPTTFPSFPSFSPLLLSLETWTW
jgi:hypothetical protein